ncbi:MAG: SAM-dependent methyltransferase [Jaaginema sp. PMC 1079.18]|nr:SAM-dependent methyltransferase [Jaaginema sp. PMC 1080.18]MEC4851874.1 SAM-dependent methyltransferase [Jaaginema sp. PMC 1079.18]MEC4868263.1 SAM-dependent methyltransferase [Jaaginema sp. PMC 1078.18]
MMPSQFKLKNIVLWGRSGSEYQAMFNLTPQDLEGTILDCGGGPSSFNAEMTQKHYKVVSCDPIYQFNASTIASRIQETYPIILQGLRDRADRFLWQDIETPEQLGEVRLAAMQQFLADFPTGKQQNRYLVAQLPQLPFKDAQFSLALCSHLLFTYTEQLSFDCHRDALLEMLRVAPEVRVFPLVENFSGETSAHLQPLIQQLRERGYDTKIEAVNYEFQRGGNQMLRIGARPTTASTAALVG